MNPRLLIILILLILPMLLMGKIDAQTTTMMPAEMTTGTTTRVSVASDGAQGNLFSGYPSISADSRYVAFESWASNLVSGDTNDIGDIFVHDRQMGQTSRVSVASDGTQGDGWSERPSISADGRYVAFVSEASNLVNDDTNNIGDIFVHDRQTGQTSRVSVASDGAQGNGASEWLSISADGRYVAFHSWASNLVSGDTNGYSDVFVHDQQTGQTNRLSVASDGTQGDYWSEGPSISANGRYVAFSSHASNLVSGDTNNTVDVFVHDRQTWQTSRVSVASDEAQGNGSSYNPSISSDGRYVAFYSYANNLVSGDTNGYSDAFVHDRQTGQTSRVSIASDGTQGSNDSGPFYFPPPISADYRYVAFYSEASNLVSGDTNDTVDVFVHDRQTGQTSRVSVASDGAQGNGYSAGPSISSDGRYVAFYSEANSLVSGDSNNTSDIFVHDRGGSGTFSISGRVSDANNNSIAGVIVSTQTGHSATSNANGDYIITGLITGTYTLTPSKSGYTFSPTSRTINLPPNATGQNFTGSGSSTIALDVTAFVADGREHLLQTSYYARDVSQTGDYFLDKLQTDAVNLVIDTTLNLWSLHGIDWGLVGQGMNHITIPGYQAALHASWRGWANDSVTRHWYKPLYDNIHNNRQLLFHESARAGFKYYAREAGIEAAQGPIKDWLIAELLPGPGTPFASHFSVPTADLAFGYRLELTREEVELLSLLPTLGLTPAQEQAYRADMLARQQAHTQMMAQLGSQRDLLWNSYQDALASENNWWNFWGKFLLKYVVIGGATLAWDGPGFYVASAGTTGVDTIYTAVAGARALAHDQKMIDQSLRFLGGRTPQTYAQISLNTVNGLNLIRAGEPPAIANGGVNNVELHSIGHYRLWPGLWWAEESSQVQLHLSNNASFPTTFMTSAAYTQTGFWSGPQRLLPEGEGKTVSAFAQDTATIPLKMPDDGLSPDDGSPVDLLVLGATETGIYPVASLQLPWNPSRIETMSALAAQPPAGYTTAEAGSAPAFPYPLSSVAINLPDSTDYQVIIGVINPFTLTVAATITQTIPSQFAILDSDGATVVGNTLIWTSVISPEVGLEIRPLLSWEAAPATIITMPATELSFQDPATSLGDSYTTDEEIIYAPWPVEVTAVIPLSWQAGTTITGSVTLTNITDSIGATGSLATTVKSVEGNLLWSATTPVNVSPGQSQTIWLPFNINHVGYVVIEGELTLGGIQRLEFSEIISASSNDIYLPIILR